jgi:hypothetical protein
VHSFLLITEVGVKESSWSDFVGLRPRTSVPTYITSTGLMCRFSGWLGPPLTTQTRPGPSFHCCTSSDMAGDHRLMVCEVEAVLTGILSPMGCGNGYGIPLHLPPWGNSPQMHGPKGTLPHELEHHVLRALTQPPTAAYERVHQTELTCLGWNIGYCPYRTPASNLPLRLTSRFRGHV